MHTYVSAGKDEGRLVWLTVLKQLEMVRFSFIFLTPWETISVDTVDLASYNIYLNNRSVTGNFKLIG